MADLAGVTDRAPQAFNQKMDQAPVIEGEAGKGRRDESRQMLITNIISIVLSVLALIVSSATAWLTLIRKGRIVMTQPTQIYFGPDRHSKTADKVFFRTLLYVTGKRGHVIENMFVRLRRGETQQNFNSNTATALIYSSFMALLPRHGAPHQSATA